MRERPIIFSGDMVRAILAGEKTQTRRVIKPQPPTNGQVDWFLRVGAETGTWRIDDVNGELMQVVYCPQGQPGDLLWVRETWTAISPHEGVAPLEECIIEYRADHPNAPYPGDWPAEEARGNPDAPKWRSSIFMPRWASRLSLRVTGVRAERLQDISPEDAVAEGIHNGDCYMDGFVALWDSINAKRGYSWASNPWVWVIDFEVQR